MGERAVLITGTSTGIGEACAKRLAETGWRVYAGVRRAEDGDRLVESIEGVVVPLIVDVADQATIDAAVAHIAGERDSLDGLVNNAGIGDGGPIEMADVDAWRQVFEVNVFGLVAMTKAAFPLVDRANGRFVHVGSIAGRVAGPGLGPYAGSKHAVEAVNWTLRGELSQIGRMSSSIVEPGEIKTEIWSKSERQRAEFEQRMDAAGKRQRYQRLSDLMAGFLADGAEKGIEPDRVAQAVEHTLTAKRPKARYLVGNDARARAADRDAARSPTRVRAHEGSRRVREEGTRAPAVLTSRRQAASLSIRSVKRWSNTLTRSNRMAYARAAASRASELGVAHAADRQVERFGDLLRRAVGDHQRMSSRPLRGCRRSGR